MCDKLVSIIVPVYNEERYLRDCILSILQQTYINIELILVDDGSINTAKDICDEFGKKDSRVRVIHKKNEGLSSARATGIYQSKGKWLMFVDNDDIISPFFVEDMMKYTKKDGIDIIAGKRIDLDEPDDYQWTYKKQQKIIVKTGKEVVEQIPEDKQKSIITPMWGKIYKKNFLLSIEICRYKDICPTIYFEDVLMTPIIYSKAKKICLIDNVYYIHREVKTSISRSGKLSKFYFEQIDSGNILLLYCKKHGLLEYYKYEVSIYIKTLLRIWCLIDETSLKNEEKKVYKKKIRYYYNLYLSEYIKFGTDAILDKIVFVCFKINSYVWGKIVRKLYYKI